MGDLLEVKTVLAERVIEWTEEWKLQGMELGQLKGEAAVLERQLRKRFGELPDELRNRLHSATLAELECWTDRVLDAPTLEQVLVSVDSA
ncbi:DUF4351 domain-containing protein [Ectothiorhodospiraceae bacterium BW-2]|nr:DUF4351 domain-containing protein [Ectothiorhodospiraceae bacterium BW-2]